MNSGKLPGACALLVLLIVLATPGVARAGDPPRQMQECGQRESLVPANVRTLCSVTFIFSGVCDGSDQVNKWKITGFAPADEWRVRPWEDQDILIMNVVLEKKSGVGAATGFMAGNNFYGDAMARIVDGEKASRPGQIPAGGGFLFPASSRAAPQEYIDLHGGCPCANQQGGKCVYTAGMDDVMVVMDVYYTGLGKLPVSGRTVPRRR